MRDFTPEEKELIVNTPITSDCFEYDEFPNSNFIKYISYLENERQWFLLNLFPQHFEKAFMKFVAMIPSGYKVVKL